jgi:hypothetical protein
LFPPLLDKAFGNNDEEDVDEIIDADFDWSQVDFSKNGTCGAHKCFFDAKTKNTNEDGFLVAHQSKYKSMLKAVYVAEWITNTTGAKHFLVDGPPVLVPVSPDQIRQLQEKVFQPQRVMSNTFVTKIYKENETAVVVQRVRKAPTPYITFGKYSTKMLSLEASLPPFCRQIPDRDALAAQLAKEREVLWKTLVQLPVPWPDAQAVVDVHGNLFFIDIDGTDKVVAPNDVKAKEVIECMEEFDAFVGKLLECVNEEQQKNQ